MQQGAAVLHGERQVDRWSRWTYQLQENHTQTNGEQETLRNGYETTTHSERLIVKAHADSGLPKTEAHSSFSTQDGTHERPTRTMDVRVVNCNRSG